MYPTDMCGAVLRQLQCNKNNIDTPVSYNATIRVASLAKQWAMADRDVLMVDVFDRDSSWYVVVGKWVEQAGDIGILLLYAYGRMRQQTAVGQASLCSYRNK